MTTASVPQAPARAGRVAAPRARRARHRNTAHPGLLRVVAASTMALWMADSTATTLVVPALAADPIGAGLPVTELTWASTITFAAIAALLVTAGRFADLVGRRAVLALGMAVFGFGACAVIIAPDFRVLLAGRLAQGIGAAMMVPSSLALLLVELPTGRRTGALAWWSASSGLGALLAQAGGGALVTLAGWRSVYVPAAVAAFVLLLLIPGAPRSRGPRTVRPDVLGALLLAVAVGCAVLAISRGGLWGWAAPRTLALAALAAAALGGAVVTSVRHGGAGAIDVRLWRRPGFGFGWLTTLGYGAESFTVLMIAPIYLRAHGMDGREAGLWLAPMSFAVIVAAPLSAMLARRRGPVIVIVLGGLTSGVAALLMLAELQPSARSLLIVIVMGLGLGALAAGTSMVGTLSADPTQYGAAVGAVTTARMLGGALGVAAASAALERPLPIGPTPGFTTVAAGCLTVAGLILLVVLARGRASRALPAVARAPATTAIGYGTATTLTGRGSMPTIAGRGSIPARVGRGPVPAGVERGGSVSAEQEVVALRRLLLELREAFAQVCESADAELAHLRVVPYPPDELTHPRMAAAPYDSSSYLLEPFSDLVPLAIEEK